MSSTLRRALSDALPKAMKERDRAAVSALRTALAAVANAEAVDASGMGPGAGTFATEVDRRHLTEPEIAAIVRGIHDELRVASDEMLRLGQEGRAGELTEQAEALHGFLEI